MLYIFFFYSMDYTKMEAAAVGLEEAALLFEHVKYIENKGEK